MCVIVDGRSNRTELQSHFPTWVNRYSFQASRYMTDFPNDRLSRYKHPESFEIVSVPARDDSGKVRRTLLRDERAEWLKEKRPFRIMSLRVREQGRAER